MPLPRHDVAADDRYAAHRMSSLHRHRLLGQALAMLLVVVFGAGGFVGQVGELLRESVHVCTCKVGADGTHNCHCPHCQGPHVIDDLADEGLAIHEAACGEETGRSTPWMTARALRPAALASLSLPTLVPRAPTRPPASLSTRAAPAPEPPPPRAT